MKRKIPLIRKQTIGENVLYTLVFTAIYLIPIFNSFLMAEESVDFYNKVFLAWSIITPYLALFLFNNYILTPLLLNRGYIFWYLFVAISTSTATFGIIEYLEQHHFISDGDTGFGELPHQATLADLAWYWNIVLSVFMFGANVGIKKFYEAMQRDEDNERLARENVEAEMYYLKYQINPHFLMNTLNNIHALIDIDTDSAKRGLIELSGMMRHVVYESTADHIPLNKDILFIKNYIDLMRIRYSHDIDIIFNYPDFIPPKLSVPPLVFIVFVENAFKHGVSRKMCSYIHIDITIDQQRITAIFENSVPQNRDTKQSSGIGLENVRRRLEHIYGRNYSMNVEQDSEKYCVTLEIPINYEH